MANVEAKRRSRSAGANGFTLIELLLVVSLLGVLTAVGMGSYGQYAETQALKTSAEQLREALQAAKSRATSQIKPAACGDEPLEGYEVKICNVADATDCQTQDRGSDYEVAVVCGGEKQIVDPAPNAPPKRYAKNVTIDPDNSSPEFFFRVQFQDTTPGSIVLRGTNNTEYEIAVDLRGNIQLQKR